AGRIPQRSVNLPAPWLLYQEKRDAFLKLMEGSSFVPIKTEGTYFQVFSYENISTLGDIEMATEMTKKHKVACIPVSVFYKDRTDNRLLRFCFVKKQETIEKATAILRKI